MQNNYTTRPEVVKTFRDEKLFYSIRKKKDMTSDLVWLGDKNTRK